MTDAPVTEVTARFVGHFDFAELVATLSPLGLFAYGHESRSSGVCRCMVETGDAREAVGLVTRACLSVEGLAVHEVSAGPYADVTDAEDNELARLEHFLAALDEDLAADVWARLRQAMPELHDGTQE